MDGMENDPATQPDDTSQLPSAETIVDNSVNDSITQLPTRPFTVTLPNGTVIVNN